MDKSTLQRLLPFLPEDATEISIKGHNTREIFFNTHQDYSKVALPAQKGTYSGPKSRWRMSEDTLFRSKTGAPVPLQPRPAEDLVTQDDAAPIDVNKLPRDE